MTFKFLATYAARFRRNNKTVFLTLILLAIIAALISGYCNLQHLPDDFVKDYGPYATGLLGSLVSVISLLILYDVNTRQIVGQRAKDERDYRLKKYEEERKEIQRKLTRFFGPFEVLCVEGEMLNDVFKRTFAADSSILMALLKGIELSENDKAVFSAILKVNKARKKLIQEQTGLIDDTGLIDKLAEANVHFAIILLASEHKLIVKASDKDAESQLKRFSDKRFPDDLVSMVRYGRKKHEKRLSQLDVLIEKGNY